MSDLSSPGHAEVRVVHAADPGADAARLALELDADVAVDVGTAERAVRVRVEAGRRAASGDGSLDDTLLHRATEIRSAAATPPPISDADVAELRHLAADLGRAGRIRQRTEARAAELLEAKVAASTGVALHPKALTSAADAVVQAESVLTTAERALAGHPLTPPSVGEPAPAVVEDPVLRVPHDDFDEAHLERRRGVQRSVALVAVVPGAGLLGYAAGAPIIVLPVAVVAASALAAFAVVRGRQRAAGLVDEVGDNHLEAAVRAVEATPLGQMAATLEAEETWLAQRARLEAERDESEEQLRLARNRWHQLAGPDADPHDADAVVRAHDPQLTYDARIADAGPTVRTVAAFHRRVQARWRVLWAALGWEEPPEPDALEKLLDETLADHRAALDALHQLEAAEARQTAAAAARRPLVLVEPRTWVAPGRLAQLLASVPPEGEIVLVERRDDRVS